MLYEVITKITVLLLLLMVLFVPSAVFANGDQESPATAAAPAEVKANAVETAALAYFS